MSNGEVKRVWAPTVEESKTGTLVFFEDHDRLMKEKDAQIERARKESEEMCNRVVSGFQLDRQKLNERLDEHRRVIEKIKTIAEKMDCTCGERYSESSYRGDILEIIERGEA